MVEISFDTGAASGSVSIDGNIIYGTDFAISRYGQVSQRTGDGALVTYDNSGLNILSGKIVIKNVSYADGVLLRDWLYTKAIFELNKFDITVPSEVDLGEGKGSDISDANFVGTDDKGVFRYIAPGLYSIEFPYSYIKT